MKTEYLILLSEIVDKMDIKEKIKDLEIPKEKTEEATKKLGLQIIMLLFTNVYKCKKEFYTFIALYKGYIHEEEEYTSSEEYQKELKQAILKAKQEDIVTLLKEIAGLEGLKDFLSLAQE